MTNSDDPGHSDVVPLNRAVGQNVRRLRSAANVTLDQLASAVRVYGLKWTTSRVVEFEKGQIPATLPTIMIVADALGNLTGNRVRLAQLFEFDGWIEMTSGTSLRAEVFQVVLSGDRVNFFDDLPFEQQSVERARNTEAADSEPRVPRGVSVLNLKRMRSNAGIADARAAKRLAMDPDEFLGYCWLLWKQTLSERAWAAAGVDASPQKIGHFTRQFTRDLAAFANSSPKDSNG